MSEPVSVITTVYNGEQYINRAKQSILQQSFTEFEWVIVNDGSTDNTWEKLTDLAEQDDRIEVHSPGRLGRAKALNYAVEQSSGEYIVNYDIDDVSYENRIATQVKFLEKNPEVGVVGSYYLLADKIRNEEYIRKPPTEHKQIVRAFARYIPMAHTMVTFRKATWKKAGKYPEIDNLIDFGLWIQIAQTDWKFANVPEVLGEHYVHQESFWNKNFQYTSQQKDIIGMHIKAIRELKLPKWMIIYSVGRVFYPLFPASLKRFVRRTLGGSDEEDLSDRNQ